MKKKYIYGFIAVAALGLFAAINMKQSITPYVGVAEARSSKATVQVTGKLVKHSTHYDLAKGVLTFEVRDDKGNTMKVNYPKAAPANFEHATGMVIIGQFSDGAFQAKELLVKCPSKYVKKADK
jgi:cytochrome c-type biogenesis protein CcmE